MTSVPNAITKVKAARGTSKPGYPCFCTFHLERGEELIINRKSDWKRHENNYHNSNESWRCRWCPEICPSFESLEGHCKKKHNKIPSKNEVYSTFFLPRQRFACGFVDCKYNGLLNNWDKRCNHVADHMKESTQLQGESGIETKWKFSTRLLRLLRQPEIYQNWVDFMTSHHGPNQAGWPTYWKLNDNTLTLIHKLECRDFRPSADAVAKCAGYLAWASAGSNAPNVARFSDFIQSVLRPPTELLPAPRARTSQDLDRELKRIPEAQLSSPPSLLSEHQMNLTSPPTTSVGFEEEPSSQAVSMPQPFCFNAGSNLDSPFGLPTSQPFVGATFSFTPTDERPHPGAPWAPDEEELPFYPVEMQSDPLEMQPMEISTVSQDNTIEPCFDNGGSTAPPPRHRTPGQFLRSMTSSLALPHKRLPAT